MRINVTYYCEYCGESFKDDNLCRVHEEKCNPCDCCKNLYYVYGCEENCKYRANGECSSACREPTFKAHFEKIGFGE